MGLFDMLSGHNSAAVQKKLFRINCGPMPLDAAARSFGELCFEFAKGVPQSNKESVVYRIDIDRNNVTARLAIDDSSGAVNFRKIIPGYLLVESYGWDHGPRHLEGHVQSIYLPDSWDGVSICEAIATDFKKGCPTARVVNQYDDLADTRTAGVIFRIS